MQETLLIQSMQYLVSGRFVCVYFGVVFCYLDFREEMFRNMWVQALGYWVDMRQNDERTSPADPSSQMGNQQQRQQEKDFINYIISQIHVHTKEEVWEIYGDGFYKMLNFHFVLHQN